jgi:hypothetical protein
MVIAGQSSFSVLRETPMTSSLSIPFQKAKILLQVLFLDGTGLKARGSRLFLRS